MYVEYTQLHKWIFMIMEYIKQVTLGSKITDLVQTEIQNYML